MKQPGNRYRKDTVGHTKESGGKQTEIMNSTNKKQIAKHQEYTGGMKQIEYTGTQVAGRKKIGKRTVQIRQDNEISNGRT